MPLGVPRGVDGTEQCDRRITKRNKLNKTRIGKYYFDKTIVSNTLVVIHKKYPLQKECFRRLTILFLGIKLKPAY